MTDSPDSGSNDKTPTARLNRASVMLSATVERPGGGAPSVHRVRDLSTGGVRIDQASSLRVGATMLVSIGALRAISATVVWVEKGSAGLHFAEPINPDEARAKTAIAPRPAVPKQNDGRNVGATAGWIPDLANPYRKS